MFKNKSLIRVMAFCLSLSLVSGHTQDVQAGIFKKIGRTIAKPFKKARNWVGRQIYKASGIENVFNRAESVIQKAENSANSVVKNAGAEARKVLDKAKADVRVLINDFDKLRDRSLKQAQKLADDISKKVSKHLNKIDGLLTKADKVIGKHLKTVIKLEKKLNKDVKERLKQIDEIIIERLNQVERIAKKIIDRQAKETQDALNKLQTLILLFRTSASGIANKAGIEGAAALAHMRYNLVEFYIKSGKGLMVSGLELNVGKKTPAIVRSFPRSIFTKKNPFKSMTLIYQDFPRKGLSGRVKAYLKPKRGKRINLNVYIFDRVKMHVTLPKGGTLLPGEYTLQVEIYRSKSMKVPETKQPPPVEILQKKGGTPVLRYQISYKKKHHPTTGFKIRKLTNYHNVKRIDTLPYSVNSLLDAKINLSLTNSDGRGVGKWVYGSREVQYSIWGHNIRLYLQSVGQKCFGKMITQPIRQARPQFWILNKKASLRKLTGPCERQNYEELRKYAYTHFMGKTSYTNITYTHYSLKSQVGVFLQFSSSKP